MPSTALPRPSAAAGDDDPDPDGGGSGCTHAPPSVAPQSNPASASTAKTSTPPTRFVGAFERVLGEAADAYDRRPHPPPSQRYNWHHHHHHHPGRRRHQGQGQGQGQGQAQTHPSLRRSHTPSRSHSHASSRASPTLSGAAGATAAAASSAAAPASASASATASPRPALSPRLPARSPAQSDYSATTSATAGSSVPLIDLCSPLPAAALDLPPVSLPVPASASLAAAPSYLAIAAAAGPQPDRRAEPAPPSQSVDACDTEQAAQDAELASLLVPDSPVGPGPFATTLFSVLSPPVIALPHLYLNHAPGLQRVRLSNPSPHTPLRLRLSSDLGDAVSFMQSMTATSLKDHDFATDAASWTPQSLSVRTQHPTPDRYAVPALDAVSWATNSLNWAQKDGLSPTKLAVLREISASLAELRDDGIVLAPQQREELFVLFRPKRVLSQRERSQRSNRRRSGGALGLSAPEAGPSIAAWGSEASMPDSFLLAAGPRTMSSGSQSSSLWSGESTSAPAPTTPSLLDGAGRGVECPDAGKVTYPTQHVHHEHYVRGTVTIVGTQLLPGGQRGTSQSMALPLRASFVKPQIRLAPAPNRQQDTGVAQAPPTAPSCGLEPAANATGSSAASSSSGQGASSLTLDLGACLAGEAVEMPLLIQNVSQIACCVQAKMGPGEGSLATLPNPVRLLDGSPRGCIDTDSLPAVLRMVDDDDDDRSSASDTRAFYPIWIPAFTARQVTVYLSPQLAHAQAGSAFRRTITITNLHDTSNTTHLHLRASILAPPPPDDPLVVLPAGDLAALPPPGPGGSFSTLSAPGVPASTAASESAMSASGWLSRLPSSSASAPVLDMGDMVGGRWARQLLLLVNTSPHSTLDVDLSATPGYEVTFERARLAAPEPVLPASAPGVPTMGLAHAGSLTAPTVDWTDTVGTKRDQSLPAARQPAAATMGCRSVSSASSGPDVDTDETPAMHALRTPVPSGGQHGLMAFSGAGGAAGGAGALETPPPLSLGSVANPGDMVLSPLSYMALSSAAHRAEEQDADSNASEAGSLDSHRQQATDLQSATTSLRSPLSAQSTWAGAPASRPVTPRSLQRSLSRYPSKSSLAASRADDASAWSEATSNSVDSRRSTYLPPTIISASSNRSGAGSLLQPMGANSSVSSLGRGAPTAGAASSIAGSALTTTSRQASAGSAGGARTDPLPLTPDAPHMTRVSLLPLTEARILVGFRPGKGAADPTFSAGKLKQVAFDLFVDTRPTRGGATVRRAVQVKARTCTSFITISPKVCDFGETSVGARKTGTLHVRNESQLTARVEVRFVSKVLSMYRDEVPIAPGQTVGLKLDFFPRRVNAKYRKQLTVTNLLNRENDQIFEVRSRNTDTQRISLHSLFYRILTPSGANFIDFGDVYINSPAVRSFTIENTSPAPLTLEVSPAQPEDLGMFVAPSPGRGQATGKSSPPSSSLAVPPDKPDAGDPGAAAGQKPEKTESASADERTSPPATGREDQGKANGKAFADAGLKERFLETLSTDSPTSIRRENASWRLAQKHAHTKRRLRKDTSPSPSSGKPGKAKDGPLGDAMGKDGKSDTSSVVGTGTGTGGKGKHILRTPRSQTDLRSSFPGGKGNRSVTVRYHRGTTFKDKLALKGLESLDLASGPPVSSHRISPKSKMYQQLDQMSVPTVPTVPSAPSPTASPTAASQEETDAPAPAETPVLREDHLRPPPALPFASTARTPSPALTDGANDGVTGPSSSPASASAPGPGPGPGFTRSAGPTPPPTTATADKGSDKDTRRRRTPALTGQQARAPKLADFTDVSKLTVEQVMSALEAQSSKLHAIYFGSPDREERAVRTEINLYRRLTRVLADPDQLSGLDTLTLRPGEQVKVWCVYRPNGSTRPHIQGNARKQDSRIYLRLLHFDASLLSSSGSPDLAPLAQLDPEELPVRELMIRAVTCRSLMELGQPHINFGTLGPGEIKVRKIVVHNRAEWPLRYCIRKSGSIASGDIRLAHGGRFGIVPGYGHRAVEFGFSPTMSGVVNERLVLENVADRDNDQTVVVKAHIRRVPNFSVAPAVLPLGAVVGDKLSPPTFFQINNISSKSRSFTVDVDRAALQGHRCVAEVGLALAPADPVQQPQVRTQAEEEEIEHAAQKLKIALRKGQQDKIAKYKDKLKQLGVGLDAAGVGAGAEDADEPKEEEATATASARPVPAPGAAQLKRSPSSAVTLALDAGRTARIAVWVRVRRTHTVLGQAQAEAHSAGDPDAERDAAGEDLTLLVRIHETKNADVTKTVQLRLHAVLDAPPTSPPHVHPPAAPLFSTSERRSDLPSAPGSYPLTPSADGLDAEAKQLAIPPAPEKKNTDEPMPPQAAIFTSHM